jgi:serine/threonine-protein kinase 24/25/MST4
MDLEHELPGSCEVFISRLLHWLGRCSLTLVSPFAFYQLIDSDVLSCSSKDSSLQGFQEMAASVFSKKSDPPLEPASNKKTANTPPLAAPTISPLARFLLTRLVTVTLLLA